MDNIADFHVLNVPKFCELTSNASNRKTWLWMAFDRYDGEPKAEWVAPNLASEELAVAMAKLILRATDHD